jgi:hypothetical protein
MGTFRIEDANLCSLRVQDVDPVLAPGVHVDNTAKLVLGRLIHDTDG